jgi:N6-adenosine-specific RNA methylase IME4/ParB-like chromosome segregation protein Spo0J
MAAGPTASAADEIDISAIRLGQRHRKDMGDIGALAANIADVGLLHPVVVTRDLRLIAGERRLRAFQRLGRTRVPVRVVPLDEIVRGEFSENAHRKDFLPSEIDAIRRALMPQEKAAAKERQVAGLKRGGERPVVENFHDGGKTRDKIGAFAGVSGKTVEKIAAVMDAAERDPERFGPLIEEMDRVQRVTGPYRKLKRALDEDRVKGLVARPGRVRTLVMDPAWPWDMGGPGSLDYVAMNFDEIAALPVQDWVEDDAHLWLWTTNAHAAFAFQFMVRWGFVQKSIITWAKPSFGIGAFFRNSTEHALFGVRGHLPTRPAAQAIPTHFEAPRGEHSEKPEAFYDIVRAASYPPYGEAFQRKARPDFESLFREMGTAP